MSSEYGRERPQPDEDGIAGGGVPLFMLLAIVLCCAIAAGISWAWL